MEWQAILAVIIAALFVLFISGKYWVLKKEVNEFRAVIKQASADGHIDDAEWELIFKEGIDIGESLKEIAFAVAKLLARR